MTVRRHIRSAVVDAGTDGDGRTVRVRLFKWRSPARVTDDGGRTWYREEFARGGITLGDGPQHVRDEHTGEVVGRAVALEDAGDGPVAVVRVADTTAGRDVLGKIDEGLMSASVEFDDDPTPVKPGSLVTRAKALMQGLAFTLDPQHPTAAVLGRRSHKETTMPDVLDDDQVDDTTDVLDDDQVDDTTDEPAADEPVVQRSHNARRAARPDPSVQRHAARPAPVSRFRSFGEFCHAAINGKVSIEERARFFRALSSATTTDISGLIQVQWINDVVDLIRPTQPMVELFSQRPLPDTGETISQPVITTRPTVGKQAAQGDAISSQKVVIGHADWTVETYGGGQEMSLKTIRRSSPQYLDEVMRLHVVEMARKLETDVCAGVVAAADDVNTAIELSNTATAYQDAFIDASDVILGSLDRFPEVAAINRKMFVKLSKALDSTGRPLFTNLSPFNQQGVLSITDGKGQIRNLEFAVCPKMANTVALAVVGVKEAYRTMIGPVETLQADVPETLSHQHAIFEFAAQGKVDARGLVLINDLV